MTKQRLQLALLGFALLCVGMILGVVSTLPTRQAEVTPALENVQHYRFPNGRGVLIETRTYSDHSQRFYALPVRHCAESSNAWQQDGEATERRQWSQVVHLLKSRQALGPPECASSKMENEPHTRRSP